MISAATIRDQFVSVLNAHAQEGLDAFAQQQGGVPVLSHACFKFTDLESYRRYSDAVLALGVVARQDFGGKEITWCHLRDPWVSGGLSLEWLELVEPKQDANLCNAVTSIGYAVPGLQQVVKILSRDDSVVFRYQAQHARDLVR